LRGQCGGLRTLRLLRRTKRRTRAPGGIGVPVRSGGGGELRSGTGTPLRFCARQGGPDRWQECDPCAGHDIARVSHSGRAGENLGEDPLLAGEIGGAIGGGIQSEGVLAVAKHYVANNFEWLRTGEGSFPRRSPAIDVRVSKRTLHEIYLEPFRRAGWSECQRPMSSPSTSPCSVRRRWPARLVQPPQWPIHLPRPGSLGDPAHPLGLGRFHRAGLLVRGSRPTGGTGGWTGFARAGQRLPTDPRGSAGE
jgi:Glycosyl hydrolase family 3 N terminal domain